MLFKLKREKASIVEVKARQAVLATVGGTRRRVVELFVTTETPLDAAMITACEPLVPELRTMLKGVASRVEDGGGGIDVKAKTKVPPMTVELHPPAPAKAPPTFRWPVAECKGVGFRVDKKGDGVVRIRWKVRATKGDLEKLPDWIGSDSLISAEQSQVTLEELEKRRKDEGKAPNANPFARSEAKGKKKKGAQQDDLPIVDAEHTVVPGPRQLGPKGSTEPPQEVVPGEGEPPEASE